MPNQFNHDTVQQYGGVAWAKQQISLLDPGAIDDQIKGYASVKASLNQIVDTLKTANASIQSSWTGDAATAATQTFTDTSNHAQNVVTTVDNTITQLQTAKTAASTAKTAMATVPDEKPVPSGGLFSGFSNTMSDIFTGTDPAQQAQQHNTAARTQAADVLNKLSTSYDTAANNMTSIAGTGTNDGGFQATTSNGGFNLGSGSYGGGSGAASSYTSRTSSGGGTTSRPSSVSGGVKNGVFEDSHTSLQSATTLPPPNSTSPIETGGLGASTTTTTPTPIFGNLGGGLSEPSTQMSKSGAASEESLFGNGANDQHAGGTSKLGSSNVFEENGFGSASGGGGSSGRGSSLGAGGAGAEGEATSGGVVRGGVAGAGEGQSSGMQHGMGGGRGGAGSGEEDLGSSKYSRGRYLGGEEPGSGSDGWVRPSVGGDESLLVKGSGSGSGTSRVTSVYEGATDTDGNPLHMMRSAGRPGGNSDEEDERGERPEYLKEDPEWWQSAQGVAPPVVE